MADYLYKEAKDAFGGGYDQEMKKEEYEAFMKAGMRARWFAEEYQVPDDRMLGFVWDTLNRELSDRNWRPEPKILLREELWDSWLPVCLMEMSLVPKGE